MKHIIVKCVNPIGAFPPFDPIEDWYESEEAWIEECVLEDERRSLEIEDYHSIFGEGAWTKEKALEYERQFCADVEIIETELSWENWYKEFI